MKVNILGQPYEIIMQPESAHDPKLNNASGYTEPWSRRLIIDDFSPDAQTVENPDAFKRNVLRHEITHAFLHESGLRACSWGDNEEIVDWIAHQGPKLFKAWQEAGALDPGPIKCEIKLDGTTVSEVLNSYDQRRGAP